MYNSSILSSYTPESFQNDNPITKINIEKGFQIARTKTVVICTLLRDVEHKLPELIKRAERVGSIFKDYKVLVVENDSNDNTRSKLLSWAKINPKVLILGCGENVEKCSMKEALGKTEGHSVNAYRINK